MSGTAHYISTKCTSCKACEPICPTRSIYYGISQYVIDTDTCEGCAICVQVCPEEAIQMMEGGEENPPDEK